MKEIVFPICALLSWFALAHRLLTVRRGNPTTVAMSIMYALLGITFTISTPAISAGLDRLTGIPNLGALGIHFSVVAYSIVGQIVLLHWTHPLDEARRKARGRLVLLGLLLATMSTLFLLTDTTDRAEHFFLEYNHEPLVVVYASLYVLALATSQVITMRICLKYAKFVERKWLRRGLRATAFATALTLVYCATRAADIVAAQYHVDASKWEILVPLFAGSAAIVGIIGLTMPAWGPKLTGFGQWIGKYRSYRQLYPLWSALYRALPGIALDPPSSALADRMTLRDLDFRLYRRVIEIRDGQRELRPWFDPAVATAASRLGRESGLSGDALETTVEAATLKAALARADGAPAETDVDVQGGSDVSSEVAWLTQVARAFEHSPVVTAALTAEPVTSGT